MESRTAEVPFRAGWEALIGVASKPGRLFSTFPYRMELRNSGEKALVHISFRRLFMKFEFEGFLEFTSNEPHATYIVKGPRGLLILSLAVHDGRLTVRASADIPGERGLGRKLEFLAKNSARVVSRMAESHHIVVPRISGSQRDFIIRNFSPSLLPHTVRYVRFNLGTGTFRITGENGGERFSVGVENDVVKRVEYESGSGSSITEVEKGILEVDEGDFGGIDARGEYVIRVTD